MDDNIKRPYGDIFGFFSALGGWALLRNADVIANYERGGDCDVLVSDLNEASEVLRRFLGEPLRLAKRSYVVNFFYPWGHIDLCLDQRWQGVVLKSGEDLLSKSSVRGEWPVISETDEIACLLLNSLLWGGFVKTRYVDMVVALSEREPEKMRVALEEMVGLPAARVVWDCVLERNWKRLEDSVGKIRWLTLLAGLARRPMGTLRGYIHFVWRELMIRLRPGLPMMCVHLPLGADVGLFEEAFKKAAAGCEYKLLLREGAEGSLGWLCERLKWRSFRAKNGLVVFWKGASRSDGMAKECIHMNLEDVSEAGVFRMIREFQRRAAVHSAR